MPARLRPSLATLPAYVPGRSVHGATKLASNESPVPPLPYVVERIARAAAGVNRYPDNSSADLTRKLAAWHGVDPEQVVVGCGAVSLLQQVTLATAGAGDEVLFAWRSFEAYPIVTTIAGATPHTVPLTPELRHDLPAMAAAVTDRTRLVVVCNPNNPTGTTVDRGALQRFLHDVPDDVVVAVDEAYFEFVADPEVPDASEFLDRHQNLVVLRTFSKAYGLAGLRIGYALAADPALAAGLRQVQIPFSVTGLAQEAAAASLEAPATAQLRERVDGVVAERERVRDALRHRGYDVPATSANFVWLPVGAAAAWLAASLEAKGIVVRAFAGSGVRVTISSPDENDAFLGAIGPADFD